MDQSHVPQARPPRRARRPLPHERQGPLPHEPEHVHLPGPPRGQAALQGLPTAARGRHLPGEPGAGAGTAGAQGLAEKRLKGEMAGEIGDASGFPVSSAIPRSEIIFSK